MPNRIIREAILSSEKVAKLNWAEEVFFRRLMSVVDDYGRFEANLQLLRSRCYPLQTDYVKVAEVTKWLMGCQKADLLCLYVSDGKQYLAITNFGQQLRSASKFPPPPPSDAGLLANDINGYQMPADAHLDVSVSVSEDVIAKAPAVPAFVLPGWIPEDAWAAYCKMRLGKRAKNEPHALGLIVKDLEVFRAEGFDPLECLNNSIKSGWAGVFRPKLSKQDVVRQTVPSAPGRDPALVKIDEDEKKASPMPDYVRAARDALTRRVQ